MTARLLLFGATGDLTGRLLLPALASLPAAHMLPSGFQIVCAARERLDDEGFRRVAAERLGRHASRVATDVRESLVKLLSYRTVDFASADSIGSIVRDEMRLTSRFSPRPLAAY